MKEYLQQLGLPAQLQLPNNAGWIVEVFVVVLAVLLFNFILQRILNRLHRTLEGTNNPWDDAFIDALRSPLRLLVWIIGLSFAANIAGHQTDSFLFTAVEPLRNVGVIACFAWFLSRLVQGTQDNMISMREAQGKTIDRSTVYAVAKLVRIAIAITAVLVILQTLGYSVSGLMAFGGIGGIAIGFAAKDLLANFFGGLMIYLDRPFSVGDWIRSPDREIEGTVEGIGWRLTCIRSFSKRPIYVPNSVFANIAVENPSRMTHRRIKETIGIRYQDARKMDAIVAAVKEMLQQHPEIDASQTMIVNFNEFAASSLNFFIYTFTHTTNWVRFHEIKQDVLLKVQEIIQQHEAEIAFPTSTVHLPDAPMIADAMQHKA